VSQHFRELELKALKMIDQPKLEALDFWLLVVHYLKMA
jgi:hypothetical protein